MIRRERRQEHRKIAQEQELWTGPQPEPAKLLQRFTELAAEQLDRYQGSDLTLDVVKGVLRSALLESLRSRTHHVNQLAEIDRFAWNTTSLLSLQRSIDTQMRLARLERITDVTDPSLFTVVEGEGESLEVIQPAYVDQTDGRLVLSGQVRRIPRVQAEAESADPRIEDQEAIG